MIDDLIAEVTRIEHDMIAAAATAARLSIPRLLEKATATKAYHDQTGATRAGTVVFVVTDDDDGSDAFAAARDLVESLHPGASYSESGPDATPEMPVLLIVTVPSQYVQNLELDRGGARAFLAPTIDTLGPDVWAEVDRQLRGVFA